MNYEVFNTKASVTVGACAWARLGQRAGERGWNPTAAETNLGGGYDVVVLEAADAAELARITRALYPNPAEQEVLPELLAILEGGEPVLIG